MSDDLLVKVILQERERQLRQKRLLAEAEHARARGYPRFSLANFLSERASRRRARLARLRTHDQEQSERKAA